MSIKSGGITKNKLIFEYIYTNQVYNNYELNLPLSGPGSLFEKDKHTSNVLNCFIYNNNCKSVLDLGCGDLTYISKTPFFKDNLIKYIGIDIIESLITSHSAKYPDKIFQCKDITIDNIFYADIIILRDVIFHFKNDEILSIFNNIKNKFKYLLITSCKNLINYDNFDKYYFSEKNINIEPFNKLYNYLIKINESKFNCHVYIYTHDNFYNL